MPKPHASRARAHARTSYRPCAAAHAGLVRCRYPTSCVVFVRLTGVCGVVGRWRQGSHTASVGKRVPHKCYGVHHNTYGVYVCTTNWRRSNRPMTVSKQPTDDGIESEKAPTGRSTPDGYVPGGVAGFIVRECTVLCYECGRGHPDVHEHADDTELHEYSYDYIGCMSEWDGGVACEECHRVLDTSIIQYGEVSE